VHVGAGIATRDAYATRTTSSARRTGARRSSVWHGGARAASAVRAWSPCQRREHRRGRCSPLTGVIKSEGKQEKQVRRRGEGGGVGAARFQLLRRGDGLRAEMWSRRW
jgi:hypothetical protein